MLEGKTCTSCGSNLKYDRFSKLFVCPFCGKSENPEVEKKTEVTIEQVDELIEKSNYIRAKQLLLELLQKNPNDPKLLIRSLRCDLSSHTVAEGLARYRKTKSKIEEIQQYPQWDTLKETLNDEQRPFATRSLSYLNKAQKVVEVKNKIAQKKQTSEALDRVKESTLQNDSYSEPDKLTMFLYVLIIGFGIIGMNMLLLLLKDESYGDVDWIGTMIVVFFLIDLALLYIVKVVLPGMRKKQQVSQPIEPIKLEPIVDPNQKYYDEIAALEQNMSEDLSAIKALEKEIA